MPTLSVLSYTKELVQQNVTTGKPQVLQQMQLEKLQIKKSVTELKISKSNWTLKFFELPSPVLTQQNK